MVKSFPVEYAPGLLVMLLPLTVSIVIPIHETSTINPGSVPGIACRSLAFNDELAVELYAV